MANSRPSPTNDSHPLNVEYIFDRPNSYTVSMYHQSDGPVKVSAVYLDPADGHVTTRLIPASGPNMYGSYHHVTDNVVPRQTSYSSIDELTTVPDSWHTSPHSTMNQRQLVSNFDSLPLPRTPSFSLNAFGSQGPGKVFGGGTPNHIQPIHNPNAKSRPQTPTTPSLFDMIAKSQLQSGGASSARATPKLRNKARHVSILINSLLINRMHLCSLLLQLHTIELSILVHVNLCIIMLLISYCAHFSTPY